MYNALCAGGKVILLTNFVVEQFIFNGSVQDLIDIKFSDPYGPKADEPKGYAIVRLPLSAIPADKPLIPGLPSTHIPVPMVKMRCKKNCCKIETFTLRMAIGLTGHKAQGMTIAKMSSSKNPCSISPLAPPETPLLAWNTYVMTGRAKTLADFAIGNKVADLDRNKLLKITTMPKDVERREFQ